MTDKREEKKNETCKKNYKESDCAGYADCLIDWY